MLKKIVEEEVLPAQKRKWKGGGLGGRSCLANGSGVTAGSLSHNTNALSCLELGIKDSKVQSRYFYSGRSRHRPSWRTAACHFVIGNIPQFPGGFEAAAGIFQAAICILGPHFRDFAIEFIVRGLLILLCAFLLYFHPIFGVVIVKSQCREINNRINLRAELLSFSPGTHLFFECNFTISQSGEPASWGIYTWLLSPFPTSFPQRRNTTPPSRRQPIRPPNTKPTNKTTDHHQTHRTTINPTINPTTNPTFKTTAQKNRPPKIRPHQPPRRQPRRQPNSPPKISTAQKYHHPKQTDRLEQTDTPDDTFRRHSRRHSRQQPRQQPRRQPRRQPPRQFPTTTPTTNPTTPQQHLNNIRRTPSSAVPHTWQSATHTVSGPWTSPAAAHPRGCPPPAANPRVASARRHRKAKLSS